MLTWPLQEAGSALQVAPAHAAAPWQAGVPQQVLRVAQSDALHGQHSSYPCAVTMCVPEGQVCVSPLPLGQAQPGSMPASGQG
ncbi:MAG TPA: hypothetical protein VH208_06335 [Myxococcaceae bacterium]|nr:hypothetical protein [Myxococcaceae bacterium]